MPAQNPTHLLTRDSNSVVERPAPARIRAVLWANAKARVDDRIAKVRNVKSKRKKTNKYQQLDEKRNK